MDEPALFPEIVKDLHPALEARDIWLTMRSEETSPVRALNHQDYSWSGERVSESFRSDVVVRRYRLVPVEDAT